MPQNATIIPGRNASFHCEIVNATSVWRLENANVTELTKTLITLSYVASRSENRRFFLTANTNSNVHVSDLTIEGNVASNFTKVQCICLPPEVNEIQSSLSNSSVAFLRIIGKHR